ncbi:serine protease [Allomuricauda sp. XS_ASV26]|uniref:S1 family peptidase n=1 Tax=Allomuricauda sp. XS_ASV26 TaxID=3241292 RepID=UPI00351422D8
MKYLFIIVCQFLLTQISAQTNHVITANILENVYRIETDTLSGTCFLTENNGKEYLITARHLFKTGLKNKDSTKIKLSFRNTVKDYNAEFKISSNKNIDIAVLSISESLKKLKPLPSSKKIIVGQDMFFLGFPSFNKSSFFTYDKELGILPLVKKAIFSGGPVLDGYNLLFLDGHNNPGFSGGPVISYDYSLQSAAIVGIISGYYPEERQAKNRDEIKLDAFTFENSGIIKCFPFKLVSDIITSN